MSGEEKQPDDAWWPKLIADMSDDGFLLRTVIIGRKPIRVYRFSSSSRVIIEHQKMESVISVPDLATLRVALLYFSQTGELPK
jgi:hypothetical protein